MGPEYKWRARGLEPEGRTQCCPPPLAEGLTVLPLDPGPDTDQPPVASRADRAQLLGLAPGLAFQLIRAVGGGAHLSIPF